MRLMSDETLNFNVPTITWIQFSYANLRIRLSEVSGAVRRFTADERRDADSMSQRHVSAKEMGQREGSARSRRRFRPDF